MDTILQVPYQVLQTETFIAWHGRLRDMRAKVAIARRLERIEAGSLGDAKSLGGAVSELRVYIGPGYRLYFTLRKRVVVILLCAATSGHSARTSGARKRWRKRCSHESKGKEENETAAVRHGGVP
jgi:putative addiction module killer protein